MFRLPLIVLQHSCSRIYFGETTDFVVGIAEQAVPSRVWIFIRCCKCAREMAAAVQQSSGILVVERVLLGSHDLVLLFES